MKTCNGWMCFRRDKYDFARSKIDIEIAFINLTCSQLLLRVSATTERKKKTRDGYAWLTDIERDI